jgi:hypothetical protein
MASRCPEAWTQALDPAALPEQSRHVKRDEEMHEAERGYRRALLLLKPPLSPWRWCGHGEDKSRGALDRSRSDIVNRHPGPAEGELHGTRGMELASLHV